jgi:hypothetical protein
VVQKLNQVTLDMLEEPLAYFRPLRIRYAESHEPPNSAIIEFPDKEAEEVHR